MENTGTVVSATKIKIYYENGTILQLEGEPARNITQILFSSNPNIHKLNWNVTNSNSLLGKIKSKITDLLP